ncbi:MAG: hypothetical protein ACR2PL_25595, partial [Dehalococcoidia bacterium]
GRRGRLGRSRWAGWRPGEATFGAGQSVFGAHKEGVGVGVVRIKGEHVVAALARLQPVPGSDGRVGCVEELVDPPLDALAGHCVPPSATGAQQQGARG